MREGTAANDSWHQPNTAILAASVMMMVLAVVGTRVVSRSPWICGRIGFSVSPAWLAAPRV